MKKKFLFLMALLAVSLLALAEMTVYVYKKDGTKIPYIASTVDSIGFVDVNIFADGHEWVDLGLPSGTKWATCNVGANSPEDYGDYFAWGETQPKGYYTKDSYNYNYTSNPTTLSLYKDAAYTNWGIYWRMPTRAELEELIDNCTWNWTTQNGVKGYKVTSRTNGNSIFLPAAGFRREHDVSGAGSGGDYWTSSQGCSSLSFHSGDAFISGGSCYWGYSVRPVLRE